jgi:hypothetical protein
MLRDPMRKRHAVLILVLSATAAAAQDYLPDRHRTPGALNPYVNQDNVKTTACVARWTHWVAPSAPYTNRVKVQQMRELGLQGTPDNYQEDHLVPLCVGGHPRDPRNLWPQPVKGRWTATIKDQLEGLVCRAVCRGKMPLEEGRAIFLDSPDWTKAYKQLAHLK